jgi:hypothetical protein
MTGVPVQTVASIGSSMSAFELRLDGAKMVVSGLKPGLSEVHVNFSWLNSPTSLHHNVKKLSPKPRRERRDSALESKSPQRSLKNIKPPAQSGADSTGDNVNSKGRPNVDWQPHIIRLLQKNGEMTNIDMITELTKEGIISSSNPDEAVRLAGCFRSAVTNMAASNKIHQSSDKHGAPWKLRP